MAMSERAQAMRKAAGLTVSAALPRPMRENTDTASVRMKQRIRILRWM